MLERYPKSVLGILLFINIIAYIDRSMLLGFSPQITHDIHLNNTQFGFLSGAAWVVSYSAMVIFLSTLADRLSRTRIIAGGMLIWSICTAASGMAETFGQMLTARFLVAAGEAALVPSATAILADLFKGSRRSTANGLFFMGLPLGLGMAFVLSGTVGTHIGWRGTFIALGVIGTAIAAGIAFVKDSVRADGGQHGENFLPQIKALLATVRKQPALMLIMAGFVLVHVVFAESSFVQLWLVRERGAEVAGMARQLGMLQILFGCLGAAGGGIAADRLSHGMRHRLALFPALAVVVCVPLAILSRFAESGSPLLYVGLAASFFLPLSIYGSCLSLVQGGVPANMRASIIGFLMMCVNVVAVALGTVILGYFSDRMHIAGVSDPLTKVLVAADIVIGLGAVCFFMAMKRLGQPAVVVEPA